MSDSKQEAFFRSPELIFVSLKEKIVMYHNLMVITFYSPSRNSPSTLNERLQISPYSSILLNEPLPPMLVPESRRDLLLTDGSLT